MLLGVQPWNFPYYQLSWFAAPNIMAGNVFMVKHAGCVPQCAIASEQLWRDARRQAAGGSPDGPARQPTSWQRRQAAPGLKVTSKAFGVGRRIPIAQRYRDA